ncbi:ATP-binding protein [Actinomadura viridis]|uniref:ATP-binding protein n=1 Tax=Actinomadura viridis TaxID=58110 RepID=UPI003684677B
MSEPSTIVLKACPEAVKQAREFIAMVFGAWGLVDETARTIVSELTTNAIRHGSECGDLVIVRAYLLDGRPVVETWDRSASMPVARVPGLDSESGRGLLLIEALARRWGCRPLTDGGKVVFAELEAVPK